MKFIILIEEQGSWEYRDGDIIGIDRRTWFSSGPDVYRVRRILKDGSQGKLFPDIFHSKYSARKFIKSLS